MPLTSSAKKALKVAKRRKSENDLVKAKLKSAYKGAKIAVAQKGEDTKEVLSKLYKELDTAAKKNVIHKNKASRLKSRLAKAVATSK
jgi:small subunit ribosomal protein S20